MNHRLPPPSPQRRQLLVHASQAVLMLGAAMASRMAQAQGGYTLTEAQLQAGVAQRFPRRFPVAGLLDLEVRQPRLRLLPDLNRLGLQLGLLTSGPALAQAHPGLIDLVFALRYEPRDQTLRAHQIELRSLRLEGLAPAAAELLQATLPNLVRQTLLEVVVHRLRPQDLALADGLGLRPDTLTVTADGVVVGFTAKEPEALAR